MKIRPATLIAMLALFVAIGGTATAASGLINGKKIKKGTIASKAFKKQTVTKAKIAPAAIAALAGAQGPKGETGSRGPTGGKGAAGVPGTTTVSGSATKVAQAPNVEVNQLVLNNLPASRYVATAKVNVQSQTAGSQVKCSLEAGNGGGTDVGEWTNTANGNRATLWMVLTTAAQTNQIKVVCNAGSSSATLRTELVAVQAK